MQLYIKVRGLLLGYNFNKSKFAICLELLLICIDRVLVNIW